jgi:hypothetical protein
MIARSVRCRLIERDRPAARSGASEEMTDNCGAGDSRHQPRLGAAEPAATRPVRPEQPEHIARPDLERQVVDGRQRPLAPGQTADLYHGRFGHRPATKGLPRRSACGAKAGDNLDGRSSV